jgi:hypothetical protein
MKDKLIVMYRTKSQCNVMNYYCIVYVYAAIVQDMTNDMQHTVSW